VRHADRSVVATKFWRNVAVGAANECWEWQRARLPKGYGRVSRQLFGEQLAHRAAYRLTHGDIPAGMCVMHSCDNPPCCNPDHLRVGTQADNLADMRAKGRGSDPPKMRSEWQSRGERHSRPKLTADAVVAIRALVAGGESQRGVARRYGVSHTTVRMIVLRRKWAHVL
jgi:Autographiviridae endonuclease